MTAVTILCEATMRAAVRQTIIKGIEVDAGEMAEALKVVVKANLDWVMEEWKEATEANIGEAWLRQMINVQAHELATEALASMGIS